MTPPVIRTPKGTLVITANGKAELKWNTNFRPKWQHLFNFAQRFVDSEVLRLSQPYTPLRTGTLIRTGILGTEVGSGLVQWVAPYAKARYYKPARREVGLRGAYWFARMKAVHGVKILKGAKAIMKGTK